MRQILSLLCGILLTCTLQAQESVPFPVDAAGASAPSAPVAPSHQLQWVNVDSNGGIRGKVVILTPGPEARPSARVAITSGESIVKETISGPDGYFTFSTIPTGVYGLQVLGEATYAAFALHVMPAANGPSELVEVCAVEMSTARAREILVKDMVPSFSSELTVSANLKRPVSGTHRVQLNNGSLSGRVSSAMTSNMSGTVIKIFKDSSLVAKVPAAPDGSFSVSNLSPGVYAAMMSGNAGFAAVSFEAVDDLSTAEIQKQNRVKFVALQDGPADDLVVELIPSAGIPGEQEDESVVIEDVVEPAPLPGFGFAGPGGFYGGGYGGFAGGGGGGGFGGGGGGIGGLAGAAGLAVGAAALADDDDGFNQNFGTNFAP